MEKVGNREREGKNDEKADVGNGQASVSGKAGKTTMKLSGKRFAKVTVIQQTFKIPRTL